jgi:hypothetical protein
MIGIFLGSQNSGKTLSMTYYAYTYFLKGYDIYSNYNLQFKHTKITKTLLLDYVSNKTQFEKAIFLLDEIYLVADARNFSSNANKVFSWFLLQTSKRGVNLFGTAQILNTCEKRFRENLNFMVFNERFLYIGGKYLAVTNQNRFLNDDRLYIKNTFLIKKPAFLNNDYDTKTFFIYAKPIQGLYDTKELYGLE